MTPEQRVSLHALIAAGKAAAQKLAHARILLKADAAPGGPAWTDVRIAEVVEVVEVDVTTVERLRGRFVEQGLEAALVRKKPSKPSREPLLDGRAEARLVTLACSTPPLGQARWTLRLLADRLVELEIVPNRFHGNRAAGSQKNELKPWLKEQWCIPPKADAEFVCAMEDVLDVYHRPYDEKRPLVCLDEASKQLIGENVTPLPPAPGQSERFDYEDVRHGTANLFMISEPLLGWRTVSVTERHTAKDFAEVIRWLVEEIHPDAEKIVLVMDNLNTHKAASLYEAFAPEQARRLAERLEIHHTPKHGSWLNMAEIELSVLPRQCLDRRIASREQLVHEVEAWEAERNERQVEVQWQFTTAQARTTLHRLYPVLL